MKKSTVALLLIVSFAASAMAASPPCTVPSVIEDVESTLLGESGTSNFRLSWATDDEGVDLSHYEIWVRGDGLGQRLAIVYPVGQCGQPTGYEVSVPTFPDSDYIVEVHGNEAHFASVPMATTGPIDASGVVIDGFP